MTQAFTFNLMDDTFTFVSFLHTHDAAVVHSRFLSPLAVTALNALLCLRDPLPARMQQRTVRRTEHLRFVHFLCEADRLVAPTGRFLKPTLRIKRWLTASPLDRATQIFKAAFPNQPTRRLDDLWRAYRLPGHRLASPTLALAPLFDILRRVPIDERIKITTLLKLIPLPDDTADPASDSAEAILRGVLHYLEWFEAIQWHDSSTFQLTDLGAALLNQTPSPSKGEGSKMPHASGGAGVRVRVTLESTHLKLDLDHPDYSTLYELSDYAELIGLKPQRRYRLDRDLIQRALRLAAHRLPVEAGHGPAQCHLRSPPALSRNRHRRRPA